MARSEMGMGSVAAQENLQGRMTFSPSVSDMSFGYDDDIVEFTCWNGCGAARRTALASSASPYMGRKQKRAHRWVKVSQDSSVPLRMLVDYRGTGVVKFVSTDVVATELQMPHITTSSVEAVRKDEEEL